MKKNKLPLLLAMCLSLGIFSSCDNQNNNKDEKVESQEEDVKETGENEENSNKDQEEEKSEVSNATYSPGTYESEAEGYKDIIKVKVDFDEDEITNIEVVENSESSGIGTVPLEYIPEKIVENQSLGVDKVSGATVTSNALLMAVKDAVKQAGGDVKALEDKEVTRNTEPINDEADVVVVGGGGAGLSAAVSAASEGKSVILVEKAPGLGGNTVRAGGPYNIPDEARQKNLEKASESSMEKIKELTKKEAKNDRHQELMDQLAKEIEEYENDQSKDYLFDSNALHILQTYDGGDYVADLSLIEEMVDNGFDTLNWLSENGVEWKEEVTAATGALWSRSHTPVNATGTDYIVANKKKADELGVKFYMNTKAEEIIMEDGRAVGIKGKNEDAPVEIKAKSVILTTGGFGANKEMVNEYDSSIPDTILTTNSPNITGDGLVMAKEAGAALRDMTEIQIHPLGDPITGGLEGSVRGPGVESYYLINNDGKRFIAEDKRRDEMTAAEFAQADGEVYLITSQNSGAINDEGITYFAMDVDKLIEQNRVFKADTIEELAEKIGVDPQNLKETHDKFNTMVENGEDEEFGRTVFGQKLDQGPFYASPRIPTVHHTMGGVSIDTDAHVLDEDGNPIPGLYAAGEITGGIHGGNRLGGNALLDIHVFGRIAGTNAANEIE